MSPERKNGLKLTQTVQKAVGNALEKIDYVLQGRSPEEDARIRRITMDPSSISEI